jgi:hypothetical protein
VWFKFVEDFITLISYHRFIRRFHDAPLKLLRFLWMIHHLTILPFVSAPNTTMYYTDSDFPSLEVGYDELDAQIGAQIHQAQQYPSSDDNLPATFPNDLDHMFPAEPLRLPVPSTGQSHRNHPATSSSYPTDSPPSSSIAAHPLFPNPSSFVAPEGHADRYSSVTATSGEEPPVPFKLPYNPVDPSGSFTPRMSQNPFDDPFQNVGPYINPAALYCPSFAACFDEISRAQPQDV